jgi:hypothetical protein
MKSYIKLYGPSIEKGYDALTEMMKNMSRGFKYGDMISHIITTIDPQLDLNTGQLLGTGVEVLGEDDFIIEWKIKPSLEQVKALMRRIDNALMYTGCRYTITTRE